MWSNGKDAQDNDDGRTSRRAWLSKLRPLFAREFMGLGGCFWDPPQIGAAEAVPSDQELVGQGSFFFFSKRQIIYIEIIKN